MGVRNKFLKDIRWNLAGTLILVGGALVWVATDFLVAKLFDRLRPEIERELSKPLGHPLVVGPYKGLRPWGISIGSTRLEAGLKDDSTVELSSLTIKYAPIASLFTWRPVVALNLEGTNVQLRANKDGSYWYTESSNAPSPNIGLLVRFNEPARIFLEPSNLELAATSKVFLNLQNSKATGSFQLGLPNKGSLHLKGSGYWDHLGIQARARLKNIRLESLKNIFLVNSDLKTQGLLDGDFQLRAADGKLDCEGGILLANFSMQGGAIKNSLSSKEATIRCKDQSLFIPLSKWKYGPWLTSINGDIDLKNQDKYNLNITSSIRLEGVDSSELNVNADLPFQFFSGSLIAGDLFADVSLRPFPLAPIGSLFGTSMSGTVASTGQIRGPLNAIETNFSLEVKNPQINGVRLQEEWRGDFISHSGDVAKLEMQSIGASVTGSIEANFSTKLDLANLTFKRLGGQIFLERSNDRFNWKAQDFRLDRVEVAIPPEKSFKRIFGKLSGQGNFALKPLAINGQLTMRYPRLMGLRLKELTIKGAATEDNFVVNAELFPPERGYVAIDAKGIFGGALNAKAKASGVSANWIADSALQLPKIAVKTTSASGKAEDLGEIFVKAFGDSLDSRLITLVESQASYLKANQQSNSKYKVNPNDLQGDIDALVELKGDDIKNLNLDLEISGQVWLKDKKDQIKFQGKPFVAKIRGSLQRGAGQFSLLNVPFSLLSLVVPIPSSLTGMFGLSGQYRRGKDIPDLTAELTLQDARLADNLFVLDRGDFSLSESILDIDVLLRSFSSTKPLKLIGKLPLNNTSLIDLRIESHGDALRFLDGLTDGALLWKKGTADLRFLIKGTLDDIEANGFFVLKRGEFLIYENVIKDFNAAMIFDFDRLELLNLQAKIGERGFVKGLGGIPLFRTDIKESNPLSLAMAKVPFKLPFFDVKIASNLNFTGSLSKPQIGGELQIKDGFISPPKQTSSKRRNKPVRNKSLLRKIRSFPEQNWLMKEPLNLSVRDLDAPATKLMRSSISSGFSNIIFNRFRLRLGPDVQITTPPNALTRQPLAIFDASGLITLNGALDQTLNASGVVRLIKGRVNLFTTTFNLDRSKTNVAIFSPSKGFIPFVDVTMTSRVPDTIKSVNDINSSSDFSTNGSGAFGIGGSRLIKVEAIASGPADRISDNFLLTSRPSMPRNELIGLLGGNSLNSILGGGTASLSNVIGTSFITPLLGNVSDSFSDRLQIFLYSTSLISSPKGSNESTVNEDDAIDKPEQAWVTDIGIDLNKKFNFSLQAIPNRRDVPPQGTLRYEFNSNLDLLGSLDMEGNWQSQLQLFFRY